MATPHQNDKGPYHSLCRDKRVFDMLRERFASGQEIPGIGSLESAGVSPRQFEEIMERGPCEGAPMNGLEAIVLLTGRPALFVQDGDFLPPDLDEIRSRLEPRRESLRNAISSVARLDVISMNKRYHMGTAWMLDEDVMITNRHVAAGFARAQAGEFVLRRSPSGIPFTADVDFRREYQRDGELVVQVEKVLYIEPDAGNSPDIALVRVQPDDRLPKPLTIASELAQPDEDVVTIGYPGDAPRSNNPTALDEYFGDVYGVKRLSPGRISSTAPGPFVFNHDCTTLGGNSGSCVVRLETGEVVGLHFAGVPEENNWAVSAGVLRQRLSAVRTRVISTPAPPTPAPPTPAKPTGETSDASSKAEVQPKRLESRARKAACGYDRPQAEAACDDLIFALDEADFQPTTAGATHLLRALRSARYFDLMADVAEAYRRTDALAGDLTSLLVQALIEQKELSKAIHLARKKKKRLGKKRRTRQERAELIGLLGRAYKQKYVDDYKTARSRPKHLIRAIKYYGSLEHEKWWWHGINCIACVARASRDGIRVPGIKHPGDYVQKRAAEIRNAIESKPYLKIDIWDLATAAECSLAIYLQSSSEKDLALVMKWLGAYVSHADGNAFEYSSTLRQWTEIWQLTIDQSPGSDILPVLEGELLKHRGAVTETEHKDVDSRRRALDAAMSIGSDTKQLQARFGSEGATRYKQWKKAESCAYWVCKIHPFDDTLNVKGTGFMIRGNLLCDWLDDKYYVLTNDHVVSDNPAPYQAGLCDGESALPLSADQACVSCELADAQNLIVRRVVASSSYGDLDFALLELEDDFQPQLKNVPDLQLAANLPPVPRVKQHAQRLFVIGYPGGSELAFSMSDNFLLDHEGPPSGKPRPEGRVRLHYRSPTQKGSSGSPVFNRQWKLVGLHHAGGMLNRLNEKRGQDFANEGIWIDSIRQRMSGTLVPGHQEEADDVPEQQGDGGK